MGTRALTYHDRCNPPCGRALARGALWLLWQVVRLPVLAALLVLEPFVSLILTAAGFLGLVVAVILKFSGDLPHLPFWIMMGFSVGALLLLMAYHALISLLSR